MKIIPLASHASNLDKTAKIVASDRNLDWTIYSVRGGFVLTLHGLRAVDGLYPTEREAHADVATALELCPPGGGHPIEFAA